MSDTVDTGLLFVYAEPGPNVSEQDFNDWYNIDHAPLRLTVPGFHTGLRYTASDSLSPSYLALYDLSSPSIPSTPAYTALGAKATAREKSLVPRLANLHRSVFTLISTTYPAGSTAPPPSTAYPTPYVLAVTILVPPGAVEEDFNAWYDDEKLALLAAIPGLVRIRRYKLHQPTVQLAGSRSAPTTGANGETTEPKDPEFNYLALFDITRDDFATLPAFAASVDTPWSKRVLSQVQNVNVRQFKLQTIVQKPKPE